MPGRQPSKLPRSHPRSAGAARKKRSGASPSKPLRAIPGWLWLVAGVGVGMLLTSLVKLADVPEPAVERPAQRQPAARPAPPQPKSEPKEEPAPARSETRFDFYTLLPEREVIVPDEREVKPPPPAPTPPPAKPGETPAPAPAAASERYLLQAGSFRREAEADRRRAQILLLGLEARIEPVQANGDTWYRVHAGPFVSPDKLAHARELLSGEGIETLLLRQKPAG